MFVCGEELISIGKKYKEMQAVKHVVKLQSDNHLFSVLSISLREAKNNTLFFQNRAGAN